MNSNLPCPSSPRQKQGPVFAFLCRESLINLQSTCYPRRHWQLNAPGLSPETAPQQERSPVEGSPVLARPRLVLGSLGTRPPGDELVDVVPLLVDLDLVRRRPDRVDAPEAPARGEEGVRPRPAVRRWGAGRLVPRTPPRPRVQAAAPVPRGRDPERRHVRAEGDAPQVPVLRAEIAGEHREAVAVREAVGGRSPLPVGAVGRLPLDLPGGTRARPRTPLAASAGRWGVVLSGDRRGACGRRRRRRGAVERPLG